MTEWEETVTPPKVSCVGRETEVFILNHEVRDVEVEGEEETEPACAEYDLL